MGSDEIFQSIVRNLVDLHALSDAQASMMISPSSAKKIVPLLIDHEIDAEVIAVALSRTLGMPYINLEAANNGEETARGETYIVKDNVAYIINPLGDDQDVLLRQRRQLNIEFTEIGVLPYSAIAPTNDTREDGLNVEAQEILNNIIDASIKEGASDIHIKPQAPEALVLFRIDGRLQRSDVTIPLGKVYESVANKILLLCEQSPGVYQTPVSGRIPFSYKNRTFPIRVEMNPVSVKDQSLPRFVLRVPGQSNAILQLSDLGTSKAHLEIYEGLSAAPSGIILVTGPTGSGKTTTLYAALSHIERNMPWKSISTLEDPVEVEIPRFNQIQINEAQGVTFDKGIRSLLRSDPDVMLIGEIRDKDTGTQALRAAITGHLVFSTLHTNDAVSSIGRLLDLGLSRQILADALLAITAQRMVRRLCQACANKIPFSEMGRYYSTYKEYHSSPEPHEDLLVHNHQGCSKCRTTGYSGRIAINEIVIIDKKCASMIADGASTQQIRDHLSVTGFKDLWEDGFRLIRSGITSFEEVESVLGSKTIINH